MTNVEQRLEQLEASTKHLEKSQKRYRFATIGLTIGLLCLMVADVSIEQNIVCRTLTVVSADGKNIAYLGATDNGNGTVQTYSSSGKDLVRLTTSEDGDGIIEVYNKKGDARRLKGK